LHSSSVLGLDILVNVTVSGCAAFYQINKCLFNLILVTAVGVRPKTVICFLPGRLRWTLLPKRGAAAIHSLVMDRTPNLSI